MEVGTCYHLRIDVDGDVACTYIDGILVDTRTNPDGGNYEYGMFGFREDRALYDYYNLESAYFDNFIVTNLAGGETLVSATFDAEENPFDAGTVIDGRLFVECTYAWYTGLSETVSYDLDMDFYVERQVAGIVFSAVDEDNLHMWSVNMHDSSTPILRRHVKSSGSYSSADASLSTWYTNADLLQSLHHIKIAVRGKTISTYLDSTLVDTYTDTSSTLCNGRLGFRTYHDTSHNEKTYYDNIVLTTYDGDGVGTVTFTEDFEQAGFAFDDGVVESLLGSKMLCVTSTDWACATCGPVRTGNIYNGETYDARRPADWGDAGVIVPWTVYQMYGDTRILEENYESMSLYMTWLAAQSGDGYTYNGAGTDMGDWLAYTTTTERYVSVCYYAYVAQLMTEIASALGNTNDSIAYASLYENIKEEFQTRYVNDNGLLTEDTQCAYLLALKINLLPEDAYDAAVERLATLIEENDYCLDTGFVGTGTLCQTLSAVGLNDLAYDLLLQRQNPSWMYSLDQGATTVWERWDSYTKESGFNQHSWIMNSFNHYAYGVVAEWMYRYVGGIEVDAAAPGFRNVILQPTPDMRTDIPDDQERITHATATHRSPYGLISSAWTLQDDERISYECTIPPGSTATLYLPLLLDTDEILESGTPVEEAEGVELISIADGVATLQLQSGTYEFTISEGEPDAIEQAKTQALCLRPVPFLDQLRVSSEQPLAQICVTAMNGQTIYQSQPEQTSATITTNGWTPGLYVVQAWTQEGERLVQKATKAPSH